MELTTILSWSATILILLSFFFEGVRLRWINGIGAGLWTSWGIMMGELSVVVLNVAIIGVHAWKLIQLSKEKRKEIKPT